VQTDGDGQFFLHDVAVDLPFVVDVYAKGYVATSSSLFKIAKGFDKPLQDIVLKYVGAIVVVTVLDKDGVPMPSVEVTMRADPSRLDDDVRGSWLHHKSYYQRSVTSPRGNVRFPGTPAGRVLISAKTPSGILEQRSVATEGQHLRIVLRSSY